MRITPFGLTTRTSAVDDVETPGRRKGEPGNVGQPGIHRGTAIAGETSLPVPGDDAEATVAEAHEDAVARDVSDV